MRFIIPGPPSGDSFQENVAYTLRALGHEVIVPRERSTLFRRVQSRYDDFLSRTRARHVATYEHWLLRAVASSKPDVLLCTTQVVTDDTLARLRQLGVRHLVAWWGDAPGQMRQMGLLSDLWTAIFLKDPDAVEKFRRVKLNAHLLHEAMNPAWHKPNSTQFMEGNSLNCRAFEIAGAAGFQICEYRPIIEQCFVPGKELVVFRTYDELIEHVHRAIRFPSETRAIREAGARRALAEHTYRHRLHELLTTIRRTC